MSRYITTFCFFSLVARCLAATSRYCANARRVVLALLPLMRSVWYSQRRRSFDSGGDHDIDRPYLSH
jgi:uncharacterized membrane protein